MVLSVTLAMPARADGFTAARTIIVVAATTLAAAIVVVVAVSVHHRHEKDAISGCVVAGDNGMRITDEENGKSYVISGDTTDVRPGDRMRLLGKKVKPKGSDKTGVWEAKQVIKDFGVCQPRL
jgi:hypothetical protein